MPYDVSVATPGYPDRQTLVPAGAEFEYPDELAVDRVQNPDDHMEAADPEAFAAAVAADAPPVDATEQTPVVLAPDAPAALATATASVDAPTASTAATAPVADSSTTTASTTAKKG